MEHELGQPCTSPVKESSPPIDQVMGRLEKKAHILHEELDSLANALAPVLGELHPETCKDDQEGGMSPLHAALLDLERRYGAAISTVHSLQERLTI